MKGKIAALGRNFIPWFRTRTADYVIAGGLLIIFLFLHRTRSYLVAHYGNEIGAITDRFYRQVYDVAFFTFVVILLFFFLWVVIERKNIFFLIVGCLVIGSLSLYQFFYISKDTIYGDRSARQNLIIDPRYKYLRIEANSFTQGFKAQGRLSPDFAQVYFSAQKGQSLEDAYNSNTRDPWGRHSRYPPFFHFFCSLTFCNLDYGFASWTHLMLQLTLFLAGFVYVFAALHIREHLFPNLILVGFCLFLTPVGLAWFERGQFSLYVGLAYLCLIFGLVKRNWLFLILSALFSYVKWTSFPYTFTVLMVFLLTAFNPKDLKQRLILASYYCATILILFISFWQAGLIFLNGLFQQELGFEPKGINLAYFLPVYAVKLLPIFLIFLGFIILRKKALQVQIPFFISVAVLMNAYPTHAYDYSLPALLAFLPFLLYWSKQSGVPDRFKNIPIYLFYIFLISASFSIRLFVTERILTGVYIILALIFLCLPFYSPQLMLHSHKAAAA